MKLIQKRIFLGNLPSNLSKFDIAKELREFGNVQSVELKQRKDDDGNVLSSFAFVNIETETDKLYSCFRRFQNETWGNHKVKLELARESFLERLKREQNEANLSKSNLKDNSSYDHDHSLKRVDDGNQENLCNSDTEKNHKPIKEFSNIQDIVPDQINRKRSHKADKQHRVHSSKVRVVDDDLNKSSLEETEKAENVPVLSDENETCKRYGSLVMFSGTKNLKNLDDNNDSRIEDKGNKDTSKIIGERLKDEEMPRSHGRLPMFSGTKCLNDICDSDVTNNLSLNPRKKTSNVLSSPRKKHISESESTSERKKFHGATIDDVVHKEPVKENNFHKERINNLGERKRKKAGTDRKAEEKRLCALEERNKTILMQKEAVKKALTSVDVKKNSNKIIFDEDEDMEDEGNFVAESSSKSRESEEVSKPKLFEDSSDDESMKDVKEEDFKIKPQFEGPKGQKLLSIQSRYGNDSRFNLDERFLESEEEKESQEEEEGENGEEDFKSEKQRQLNILQEILGVDVSTKPTKKERPENRNQLQMVRFDPTNPEHSKYLVKEENKESDKKKEVEKEEVKKKKKKKEENVEEENPIPTSSERYYEVSDLLKESLKKPEEDSGASLNSNAEGAKGFSLLKAFGSAPSHSEEEAEEVESYATRPIKGGLHEWDKNPFKYDSSDEEPEETFNDGKKSSSDKISGKGSLKNGELPAGLSERFHFKDDDPRLEEGLAFFRVEKTFEEMKEGFQEKRTDLKLIIKAKVRNNKRKKMPFRKKLGGFRRKFSNAKR